MNKNMNIPLLGVLFLSVVFNVVQMLNSSNGDLDHAAKKLSAFGSELGEVSKQKPLTAEQKKNILELARVPVPIAKAINNNAVIASGVNNSNFAPVAIRTDTGEILQPCGTVEKTENGLKGCDIEIVDPPADLASAINATKPIHGKVIKDGKEIPATFVIEVKALYKGSWCQTYYSAGKQIRICWDLPNL